MRAFFVVLLVLACVLPVEAGLAVPSGSDLIVTVSCGEGGFKKFVSAWAMFPQATEPVADEHIAGFAKEWGVDLSLPFSVTFAAPRSKMDDALLTGTVKLDRAVFAHAVKLKDPAAVVTETPEALTVKEKTFEAVIRADGTFEIARAGRTGAKPDDALAKEFARRAGENATLAVWMNLPAGLPGAPPPAIQGQPIAGLWPRVRGAFFALREKDVACDLTFVDADSAKAGQPMIAGYLKTIEGALGTQAASAEQAARSKPPVNWMDPTWLGALLAITVDGPRLAISFPRDSLPGGNPAVTTAIIGVLAAIAVPNFQQARDRANARACFANRKIVSGALEMYKLDRGKAPTELSAGVFEELKTGGYLMSVPTDPGQGPGSTGNYYMTPQGIACRVHGAESR